MITKNLDRLFAELQGLSAMQKQVFVMRMIGSLAPIVVEVHWEHAIEEAKKGMKEGTAEDRKKERPQVEVER